MNYIGLFGGVLIPYQLPLFTLNSSFSVFKEESSFLPFTLPKGSCLPTNVLMVRLEGNPLLFRLLVHSPVFIQPVLPDTPALYPWCCLTEIGGPLEVTVPPEYILPQLSNIGAMSH